MKYKFFLFLIGTIFSIVGCKNADDQLRDDFKNTSTGKAVYSCVSTDGDLKIDSVVLENQQKAINVELIKTKSIELQFSVNKELNQAKLIGASVPGEKKVTKMALMLDLELMCGPEVASQILPEVYKALSIMNMFK